MVPHAALHQERLRANEAIRNFNLLQARTNALLAQRAPEPTAPVMPAIEDDPAAYFQALEERVAKFENAGAEEARTRQIDTALEADEKSFLAYTPDYDAASEHYVQSRGRELLQFHTPEQAQQIMRNEVRQIASQAWERGIPAGQVIYNLAMSRGYVKGAPSPFADPAQAPAPQNGGPAAARTPPAPLTPAAQVAAVRNGQGASRSLGAAEGGATGETLSADALLAMSDEEFEKYLKLGTKQAESNFRQFAGN
jgi:hypothetical protein